MHKIIYFGNKPLLLSNPIIKAETIFQPYDNLKIETELSDDKVAQMIEAMQQDDLDGGIFESTNTDLLLQAFEAQMEKIVAGGGLVYTPQKTVLLIFRRGKWDLPKGKLDEGETLEACAVREVKEETGLSSAIIEKHLTTTWHTYHQDGKLILKESHWYLMQTPLEEALKPQEDEDIESCRWVPLNDLQAYMQNTHPSIIDVIKAGQKEL
jgi:8-oxo-dGTP pyrophosphatase MutT (NUDIX family)